MYLHFHPKYLRTNVRLIFVFFCGTRQSAAAVSHAAYLRNRAPTQAFTLSSYEA